MDLGIFIIGFIIFVVYVYFLVWNIFYGTKKQREETENSSDLYVHFF